MLLIWQMCLTADDKICWMSANMQPHPSIFCWDFEQTLDELTCSARMHTCFLLPGFQSKTCRPFAFGWEFSLPHLVDSWLRSQTARLSNDSVMHQIRIPSLHTVCCTEPRISCVEVAEDLHWQVFATLDSSIISGYGISFWGGRC